jgi:hypothetical protein
LLASSAIILAMPEIAFVSVWVRPQLDFVELVINQATDFVENFASGKVSDNRAKIGNGIIGGGFSVNNTNFHAESLSLSEIEL